MNGLFEITVFHFTNKIAHIPKCPFGPLFSFSLSVECLQEFHLFTQFSELYNDFKFQFSEFLVNYFCVNMHIYSFGRRLQIMMVN